MSGTARLEDAVDSWRRAGEPLRRRAAEEVLRAVEPVLADLPPEGGVATPARLSESVSRSLQVQVETHLFPGCLDWVRDNGHWENEHSSPERVRAELLGSLVCLPALQPKLPLPTLRIPFGIWPLLAGAGAVAGALVLGPLSNLALNQPETGLLVGAAAGAMLLVGLVAFLASRPALLNTAQMVMGVGTGAAGVGAAWRVLRGSAGRWLLGSLITMGATSLLLYAARMRPVPPRRQDCIDALRLDLEEHLSHMGDLILALCWSHPERTAPVSVPSGQGEALSPAICDALTILRQRQDEGGELLGEAVQALLQRFEEEGYGWRFLDRGTPFEEDQRTWFDTFGMTPEGQPVETLQPAVLRGEVVVRRGMLRRVR